MRAIVTGGAGFIGSHVVDALAARGDEVHVLDDFSNGKRENVAD
ncbi:MAG TPA: NAD-dependent epimerase/dehydratase family protein, partial [Gaiellaceae bacterium]